MQFDGRGIHIFIIPHGYREVPDSVLKMEISILVPIGFDEPDIDQTKEYFMQCGATPPEYVPFL
jgi:hypothetical protein